MSTTDSNPPRANGADEGRDAGFAPTAPTDGRVPYDAASKWNSEYRGMQRNEGLYLASLAVIALGGLGYLVATTIEPVALIYSLGISFACGVLGGTTFSAKWWYHTIAKGIWNVDRRPWRFSVPWISGIVAMFVSVLFASDLIGVLNPKALDQIENKMGISFLAGYFSDSAIAKLTEIAQSLFGAREHHDKTPP